LHFAGDGCRHFLIHYRAAGNGREGGWDAVSLPPEYACGVALDLRVPDHAQRLAAALEAADLNGLGDGAV
jgi:hypothetical protein